ncbi:MAG: Sulfide dehydrogenase subunit alpha precursor [Methanobacterium sp. PtaU1.Bin242]|nr:MAG: Sulfide dehydrogenase subunit alpha precursor [Methanobacterium sp. PtaU1.Bin242]
MDEYDVIIVGSGPAGLTAALYSGRQNFKTLVLEKALVGGMGSIVPLLENYPGFELIAGKQLVDIMKDQALKYAEIKDRENVEEIEIKGDSIKIGTDKSEYITKTVILATGAKHRQLGVPGEDKFLGRGVAYCAMCDGPIFVGRKVLVVGGGNSAVQQALYLDNIGVMVALVHRRDELRAEGYLQDELEKRDIPVFWDSEVEEIRGLQVVESVLLHNKKTGKKDEIPTDGVFIAVGEIPSNQLAKKLDLDLDQHGYVITDKAQRTNVSRIYAAGDITGGVNQWVVACSEGAVAALSAYQDIQIGK